jgi:hypothetical protein
MEDAGTGLAIVEDRRDQEAAAAGAASGARIRLPSGPAMT